MATTPTDDPLANSDRTVGLHAYPDDATKALKRDSLLFDQIAVANLDRRMSSSLDELFWLRDIGIVLAISPFHYDDPHQFLDAITAVTGEPIDVTAIPDEQLDDEVERRLFAEGTLGTNFGLAVLLRIYSTKLRRDGINAFPILPARRRIGNMFASGTTPVLEVILKSMPIPDDQTPWEDIIEFRNDPESMKRLRRLRVWVRKFAHATTAKSLAEMKEEIEVLLDEYEEHMKLHRMKVNKGATETLLTVAGKVAEDFVKLKWGELTKLPFILRERKISLLEAEAKAPNRELAFISIARGRFSR
jgi:hypothetical protein